MKKVLSKILSILLTVFILLCVALSVMTVVTKRNNHGVANIFGNQFMVVKTDSMEPYYPVSTLLTIKKVDPSTIKVGDDIAYIRYQSVSSTNVTEMIITHRVIEVREPTSEDGEYTFVTRGINTNSSQCTTHLENGSLVCQSDNPITEEYVMGKVTSQNKVLGKLIYTLFFNKIGLACVIFIPVGILVISSAVGVFKAVGKKDKEGDDNNEEN